MRKARGPACVGSGRAVGSSVLADRSVVPFPYIVAFFPAKVRLKPCCAILATVSSSVPCQSHTRSRFASLRWSLAGSPVKRRSTLATAARKQPGSSRSSHTSSRWRSLEPNCPPVLSRVMILCRLTAYDCHMVRFCTRSTLCTLMLGERVLIKAFTTPCFSLPSGRVLNSIVIGSFNCFHVAGGLRAPDAWSSPPRSLERSERCLAVAIT